jgi:hypothetical protein
MGHEAVLDVEGSHLTKAGGRILKDVTVGFHFPRLFKVGRQPRESL